MSKPEVRVVINPERNLILILTDQCRSPGCRTEEKQRLTELYNRKQSPSVPFAAPSREP